MLETKYLDLCKPLCEERVNVIAGRLYDEIDSIHKEGRGKKEEGGRREVMTAVTTTRGIERRGRGPHPWRTPLKTTRYTVLSPPEVLLLLTPNPPRTKMMNRGAWWEYFSSGYAQWDTWRRGVEER